MESDQKVLILYSWDDSISARRLRAMQASHWVADIPFEHCFALKHEGEAITSNDLVERVSACIDRFQPSVFLLHTGMAFSRQTAMFLVALTRLKDKYPTLRFGYEKRGGEIIDDFKIEALGRCIHVLNAPSPAATACLAIGESINETATRHFRL